MAYEFDNDVFTTLNASIIGTDTTITVVDATAPYSNFTAPAAGNVGVATIADQKNNPTKKEIITYTGVTDNGNGTHSLTGVTRGTEGTAAQSFAATAVIFQAVTAGVLDEFARPVAGEYGIGGDGIVGFGLTVHAQDAQLLGSGGEAAFTVDSSANSIGVFKVKANRGASAQRIGGLSGYWSGKEIGRIEFESGPDAVNKDDGIIVLSAAGAGGAMTEMLRLDPQATRAAKFSSDVLVQDDFVVLECSATAADSSAIVVLKNDAQQWNLVCNTNDHWLLHDVTGGNIVLRVEPGAGADAIRVSADGVGLSGAPVANYAVTVADNTRLALLLGTSTTQTSLGHWSTSETDIAGLHSGSAFGTLIEGRVNGHVTIGIRDNGPNDVFSIISGGGDYNLDQTYDTVVMEARADGDIGFKGAAEPGFAGKFHGDVKLTGGLNLGDDTLSNYVEGSFTPDLEGSTTAGAMTFSANTGRYVRIGNQVFFWIDMAVSSIDTAPAGSMRITGLPFTSRAIGSGGAEAACALGTTDHIDIGTDEQLVATVNGGQDYIALLVSDMSTTGASAFLNASALGTEPAIVISGTYLI